MGGIGPEHQESGQQEHKTHATRPPSKALESQQCIQSRIIWCHVFQRGQKIVEACTLLVSILSPQEIRAVDPPMLQGLAMMMAHMSIYLIFNEQDNYDCRKRQGT